MRTMARRFYSGAALCLLSAVLGLAGYFLTTSVFPALAALVTGSVGATLLLVAISDMLREN